jgi:hypothetical protein
LWDKNPDILAFLLSDIMYLPYCVDKLLKKQERGRREAGERQERGHPYT